MFNTLVEVCSSLQYDYVILICIFVFGLWIRVLRCWGFSNSQLLLMSPLCIYMLYPVSGRTEKCVWILFMVGGFTNYFSLSSFPKPYFIIRVQAGRFCDRYFHWKNSIRLSPSFWSTGIPQVYYIVIEKCIQKYNCLHLHFNWRFRTRPSFTNMCGLNGRNSDHWRMGGYDQLYKRFPKTISALQWKR